MTTLDDRIIAWLNQWVGHFPVIDGVARVLISDYFALVLGSLMLLAMWFWGQDAARRDHYQRSVLAGLFGVGFTNLTILIINSFFFRPRPFVGFLRDLSLFYAPSDSSFPANPVAVVFAISAGLWLGNRKAGLAMGSIAALLGLSRMYGGVFYLSDVVVGALIGIGITLLARRAMRIIEPIPTLVLRLARALYLA
jgi:membrane-associated phospholipid phosphatase